MSAQPDLDQVQERLQVRFRDLSLLLRALTHRSFLNEHPEEACAEDNERLEFLGDAVLDFVAGDWLYNRFPELREGRLTRLRAALVRTETLADFARQCTLGEALRLGRGEEESGGRERQANLCGAFEAFIGAMYLDQGLDAVRAFVHPFFVSALEVILAADLDKDAKSLLQEWSQAHFNLTPTYHTIASSGPDHAKEFTVEVLIGEEVYGRGTGHSKRAAEQKAAHAALEKIDALPGPARYTSE